MTSQMVSKTHIITKTKRMLKCDTFLKVPRLICLHVVRQLDVPATVAGVSAHRLKQSQQRIHPKLARNVKFAPQQQQHLPGSASSHTKAPVLTATTPESVSWHCAEEKS